VCRRRSCHHVRAERRERDHEHECVASHRVACPPGDLGASHVPARRCPGRMLYWRITFFAARGRTDLAVFTRFPTPEPLLAMESTVEQLHGVRAVPLEHVAQRAVRLVLEGVGEHDIADAVDSEVAEVRAHLAPRREGPRPAPEEDTEWANSA